MKDVVTNLVENAHKYVSISLDFQAEREWNERARLKEAELKRAKTKPTVLTQQMVNVILEQYAEPPHSIDEVDVLDIVAQVDCTFLYCIKYGLYVNRVSELKSLY